jgi:hypothetical protein
LVFWKIEERNISWVHRKEANAGWDISQERERIGGRDKPKKTLGFVTEVSKSNVIHYILPLLCILCVYILSYVIFVFAFVIFFERDVKMCQKNNIKLIYF